MAGGDVYFSRENNRYYVPNPFPTKQAKHYWKQVYGKNVEQMKKDELDAGRGGEVYHFATTDEAKAAAEAEALQIAAAKGDENALSILFGTFTE